MRLQAYNDNGTMKFRQVSGSEAIDSLPVGTITAYYGGVIPNGYLLCDGSTYDTAKYPELFTLLGVDTTPDLRECVLVGVGENDTDTIADHDVYTLGEFKDDQLQEHTHSYRGQTPGQNGTGVPVLVGVSTATANTGANAGRSGTTTHGKQKGVNYLIKAATIGISDVSINAVKTALSYSTEETLTGGTWIDGKPIYRRVFNWTTSVGSSTNFEVPYLGTMVDCSHIVRDDTNNNAAATTVTVYNRGLDTCYLRLAWLGGGSAWSSTNGHWWVEYTKATD